MEKLTVYAEKYAICTLLRNMRIMPQPHIRIKPTCLYTPQRIMTISASCISTKITGSYACFVSITLQTVTNNWQQYIFHSFSLSTFKFHNFCTISRCMATQRIREFSTLACWSAVDMYARHMLSVVWAHNTSTSSRPTVPLSTVTTTAPPSGCFSSLISGDSVSQIRIATCT